MSHPVCRAVAVLTLVISPIAHAGWSHRYDALSHAQGGAIAALPNAGYTVGVTGPRSSIAIIDANGEVKAARVMNGAEMCSLSANTRGEIYLAARRPYPADESLLVKLRPDLAVAWVRVLAVDEKTAGFNRAVATRDGGVVVAAYLNASIVIIKVSAAGDIEWATRVDPSGNESIRAIAQVKDGGYVAAGASPRWPWLVRLSSDGTVLWQRAYGPDLGPFRSVVETENGELFATGNSGNRAIFVRASSKGDVLWAQAAPPMTTGGSAIGSANGTIATFTASQVVHVVAMNRGGAIEWQQIFDIRENGVMLYEFENAVLAGNGGDLALPFARSQALTVHSGSMSAGPTDCGWTAGERSGLTPITLRDETVVIERSRLPLTSRQAEVRLLPLEARATQAACPRRHAATVAAEAVERVLPDPYRDDFTIDARSLVKLLVARNFDALENLAKTARNQWSNDPLRPNNAIHTFYGAFNDNSVAPLAVRLQRTREWLDQRPRSIVAHIARATVLYDAAWISRGTGHTDTITNTGAADYEELMTEVVETLGCAGFDAQADPHYWSLAIAATHELGLGDVRKVGLRALTIHTDPTLAEDVVRFLHPQWGGTHAEYLQFADAASRVTERAYGDAMYMWLITRISDVGSSYKDYDIDWSRVRRGAERLIAMHPGWLPSYHRYAKLAFQHKDDATLGMLFQRPELEWYEGAGLLWLSRGMYDVAKTRALANAN